MERKSPLGKTVTSNEAKWATVPLKLRKQSENISSSETAKNYEIE